MEKEILKTVSGRRKFLGTLTTGAAAMGMAGLITPAQQVYANPLVENNDDEEDWFRKLRGKHKMVFDVTQPHEIFPFAWPRVFMATHEKTGTPLKELNAVVVLRHSAIPYAMDSKLWAKYKFGEFFKADDPATKQPAIRNPFWQPAKGAFMLPGVGEVAIGINDLQDSGAIFCVCDTALTVYSAVMAANFKMDAGELKKEWVGGLLPGVKVVPNGVWALGRAQENGCAYCFAG